MMSILPHCLQLDVINVALLINDKFPDKLFWLILLFFSKFRFGKFDLHRVLCARTYNIYTISHHMPKSIRLKFRLGEVYARRIHLALGVELTHIQ